MSPTGLASVASAVPGIDGATSLRLTGQATMQEAPALRLALLEHLRDTTEPNVVIELSGIERMDTAGAAILAEALKAGLNDGRHVLLCSPSEAVLKIFRLAGFDEVLSRCCSDPAETRRRLLAS